MLFTPNQVQELLDVIERNHIIYAATNIGVEQLSSYDKMILDRYGIDLDNIKTDFTPFEQSFYFGRLSQTLSKSQASQLDYSDLLKYLRRGQYIPLNKLEQDVLNLGKKRAYGHIKNLGRDIGNEVDTIITEEDKKLRFKKEKIIKEEINIGIEERRSQSTIAREIGRRTGDWQRNLGRIVDTEYNTIFQEGRLSQIIREKEDNVWIYKDVFPGACRHCIKLYLTNGIGSKPRLFRPSELIANGTNIGRKVADWKAVLDSTHPYCRCTIMEVLDGMVWDEERKRFDYPEKYERKIERKSKIKVSVGDKEFNV